MQDNLLEQGVELMLYGMGTVFVFLAVLIVAMTIMSSLMQRYVKPVPAAVPPSAQRKTATNNDEQLIAVISAAIHKYRSRHK